MFEGSERRPGLKVPAGKRLSLSRAAKCPPGGVDKETLCGRPRTRRGRASSDVRRRHGNMRTQAPGNFKPGSSSSSWSSGPALGRTSSPHPQPYPVSAKWADARTPRSGLSPSGPQHVGVRSAPEVAAALRQRPTRPSPLTGWSSSTRSPESALMALCPPGSLGATAAGPSLAPRDAAASGTCGRRGLRGP